jgi:hypothetical protein
MFLETYHGCWAELEAATSIDPGRFLDSRPMPLPLVLGSVPPPPSSCPRYASALILWSVRLIFHARFGVRQYDFHVYLMVDFYFDLSSFDDSDWKSVVEHGEIEDMLLLVTMLGTSMTKPTWRGSKRSGPTVGRLWIPRNEVPRCRWTTTSLRYLSILRTYSVDATRWGENSSPV